MTTSNMNEWVPVVPYILNESHSYNIGWKKQNKKEKVGYDSIHIKF